MPADPRFNEQAILGTLRNADLVLTPNDVRSLLSLVLMATYDRKVEREFMAEMIDVAACIQITLSKLEMAGSMKALLMKVDPNQPEGPLDNGIDQWCKAWAAQRSVLTAKFARVCACPTTTDAIN
jgi:hypothetical protein